MGLTQSGRSEICGAGQGAGRSRQRGRDRGDRDALVRDPSGREKPGQPRGQDRDRLHQSFGHGSHGLQLVLGFDTSAGEQVASRAPDAFVFKTLNTTGASNMANAAEYPVKPLMLVAGDNEGKKPVVMELVGMLGLEPVDAGPLENARLLEPFAMVWIDQTM